MDDPSTKLFGYFEKLGIDISTLEHVPLFTVEESQALRGDLPGMHSKNLFLKDKKGALWLVVAQEDRPIQLNHLHKHLGCQRLSFGKPDLLHQTLGVIPGSVTPFALINDHDRVVHVAFDSAFFQSGDTVLNFHPLRNDRTTSISPNDLLKFVTSLGYTPVMLDFDGDLAKND
ncbi:prolyl-tRNA synthetase associated domain-containing protein [Thalassospira mesophila]|uniref:DNA-binding protein n=1 Tax=Thalassospira mesophila TaxID=1293891 RepID=A0A1Y2L581_9PROT|nr:prolyl-tRNA synthetase associated domain-containing protein [Thalassospira mesophila]OSQ40965.1 DNA-binding protein [Thalassospira mesophila]